MFGQQGTTTFKQAITAMTDSATYDASLLAVYKKLTFKYKAGNDVDEKRQEAFRKLMVHHLLQHGISTSTAWSTNSNRLLPIRTVSLLVPILLFHPH